MTSTTDDILTVKDAAARASVAPTTIYEAVNSGALRASRPGGKARTRIRIRERDFEAWLNAPVSRPEPAEPNWSEPVGNDEHLDYFEDIDGVRVHGSRLSEFHAARAPAAPASALPTEVSLSFFHPVTGEDVGNDRDVLIFPSGAWLVREAGRVIEQGRL